MSCQHESHQRPVAPTSKPLPESLQWLEDDLGTIKSNDLFRPVRIRLGRQDGTVILNDLELINFGSNDYLGYAGDSRLIKASAKGACSEGAGAGASPLVSGHSALHESLGTNLSSLLNTEESLIFPSGYAANMSTIACLTGPHDLIVSDVKNHASIIDGCRLSGANIQIYPHRDLTVAASLLKNIPAKRRLIVTDSLFSMDGTIAPLADMAQLAHDTKSMLLVDEAHATGILELVAVDLLKKLMLPPRLLYELELSPRLLEVQVVLSLVITHLSSISDIGPAVGCFPLLIHQHLPQLEYVRFSYYLRNLFVEKHLQKMQICFGTSSYRTESTSVTLKHILCPSTSKHHSKRFK